MKFKFLSALVFCCGVVNANEHDQEDPGVHAERINWANGFLKSETQAVPDAAYQAINTRRIQLQATAGQKSAQMPGHINPAIWESLGATGFAGRITELARDPVNTNRILAGSAQGGLWQSLDGAQTWVSIAGIPANSSISAIAFGPANSNVIYVGTGERIGGTGIWKSVDSGATWSRLSSTAPTDAGQGTSQWSYVADILVHPSNAQILLASLPNSGLHRSINGGASWTRTSPELRTGHMALDPNNANRVLLAPGWYVGHGTTSDYSIRFSDDFGATWSISGSVGSQYMNEFSFAGSAPGVVYTLGSEGRLYRSSNAGASFVETSTVIPVQGGHDIAIWADAGDTAGNRVLLGGVFMWESLNAGVSASVVPFDGASPEDFLHADHQFFLHGPGGGLLVANDGGVYSSQFVFGAQDQNWVKRNNGLNVTQFVGTRGAGAIVAGGTQDNGTLFRSAIGRWEQVWGGDGGEPEIDSQNSVVFGQTQYSGMFRFSYLPSGTVPGSAVPNCGADITLPYPPPGRLWEGFCSNGYGLEGSFYAPMAFSTTTSKLFALPLNLWQAELPSATPNSWHQVPMNPIGTGLGRTDLEFSRVGTPTGYYSWDYELTAFSPANPSQQTTHVQSGPNRFTISAIEPSRFAANELLAGSGGYEAPNAFRTLNGGQSWTSVHGNLPAVPVLAVAMHPTIPGTWYVGTTVGLFATENSGTTWAPVDGGPGDAWITDVSFIDNTTLLVATYGRSLYRVSVANPSIQIVSGGGQSVPMGGTFGQSLLVRLVNGSGGPIAGSSVVIKVPATGATAVGSSMVATTDSQGFATFGMGSASNVSGTFQVVVSTPGAAGREQLVPFSIQGGPAATISCLSGCRQTLHVGQNGFVPIVFSAIDVHGSSATSGTIHITAPNSGASIGNPSTLQIDSSGQASLLAQANASIGDYTITGSLVAGNAVGISATNFNCAVNYNFTFGSPVSSHPNIVPRYKGYCGQFAGQVGSYYQKADFVSNSVYNASIYLRPSITSGEAELFRVTSHSTFPVPVANRWLSVHYLASENRFVLENGQGVRTPIGPTSSVSAGKWYFLGISFNRNASNLNVTIKGGGTSTINTYTLTGWSSPDLTISESSFGWISGSGAGSIGMDEFTFGNTAVPSPSCRGDANNNGVLSISDATALANELTSSAFAAGSGDCNENGSITIGDASCIAALVTSSQNCPL